MKNPKKLIGIIAISAIIYACIPSTKTVAPTTTTTTGGNALTGSTGTKPTAPTIIAVTVFQQKVMRIAWQNKDTYDFLYLEHSTDGINFIPITQGMSFVSSSNNLQGYDFTEVEFSTKYYYRIRGIKANVYSDYSAIYSATTSDNPQLAVPNVPINLQIELISDRRFRFSWDINHKTETAYQVAVSANNTDWTELTPITNIDTKSITYDVTDFSHVYFFKVRAWNGTMNTSSDYSSVVSLQSNANVTIQALLPRIEVPEIGITQTLTDIFIHDENMKVFDANKMNLKFATHSVTANQADFLAGRRSLVEYKVFDQNGHILLWVKQKQPVVAGSFGGGANANNHPEKRYLQSQFPNMQNDCNLYITKQTITVWIKNIGDCAIQSTMIHPWTDPNQPYAVRWLHNNLLTAGSEETYTYTMQDLIYNDSEKDGIKLNCNNQ